MLDQRFDELMACYLDGELSETELAELHAAVIGSDSLRQRFQEQTRVNVLLRETLSERVELQSLARTTEPVRGKQFAWRRIAIAATAAALIGLLFGGALILRGVTDEEPAMGTCMSVSGSGQLTVKRNTESDVATSGYALQVGDQVTCDSQTQAMLRLTDGSILSMEPGSQLRLAATAPQVVLQQGEAYFEIAPRHDGDPPFEVQTGHSTIAVMGTVFSLVATGHTELKVYEGSVTLTRSSDHAAVNVGSQQMATTDDLAVQELSSSPIKTETLLATDDLTLDHGELERNKQFLKVEGKRRTIYLRFEIPDIAGLRSAKVRLTQDVDSGSGTLKFFVGDHSDWNENDLTKDGVPQPLREVAQHRGVVRRGQVVAVDVTAAVQKPGPLTIIITLDKTGEDDIWFGSRESDTPPELVLTFEP
ncbi:FecR family protein [Rubripirellula reticaptiva]|nr:FecR family protein [Rubripirellula reticaptiva]